MNRTKLADEEYFFDAGIIVSSTDLKGIITYANRKFCKVSAYSLDELIGKNHNIVRHPDMPHIVFKGLWDKLHEGLEWTGIIKNLRKDGRYYWTYSTITPILEDNRIIEYSSSSRPAFKSEIDEVVGLYIDLLEKERTQNTESIPKSVDQEIDLI